MPSEEALTNYFMQWSLTNSNTESIPVAYSKIAS